MWKVKRNEYRTHCRPDHRCRCRRRRRMCNERPDATDLIAGSMARAFSTPTITQK
jgi:hypothetical protein